MSKGYFTLFSAMMMVLLVSGCTFPFDGGNAASGSGIVIEELKPEFSRVMPGEPFELYLNIRNGGPFDAENIEVELFNLDDSKVTCTGGCSIIGRLYGSDAEAGTPGESHECLWECIHSDDLPGGMMVTYNPTVRITYDYFSYVTRSITLASQDEVRRIEQGGGTLPSDVSSVAEGPVSLKLNLASPVRYFPQQGRLVTPVIIEISNSGTGTACYQDCRDSENWDRISLERSDIGTGIDFEGCEDILGTSPVEIWKGRTRDIRCDLAMTQLPDGFGFTRKTITLRARYAYFIEGSASFEVSGVR